MLPKWSRPESFWRRHWHDDRVGRQSKGTERSFWTAPRYYIFLCRIIIRRLFTPQTLIGIANADVQRLSTRIKDAKCNVKWGHVWEACSPDSVAASNRGTAVELKLCLIYRRTIQPCGLCWHAHTQQRVFLQAALVPKLFQVPRTCCWTGNTPLYEAGSQTEKITDSCFDLVQQYCRDAQVIKA